MTSITFDGLGIVKVAQYSLYKCKCKKKKVPPHTYMTMDTKNNDRTRRGLSVCLSISDRIKIT